MSEYFECEVHPDLRMEQMARCDMANRNNMPTFILISG